MKDDRKTKQELLEDLRQARLRIEQLEYAAEALPKAEQAVRDHDLMLRAVTASEHNAIIMIDGRGRIELWNPAAKRMFGWKEEEAIGKDLHLLLAPERYRTDCRLGIERFAGTGKGVAVGKSLEFEALCKDGTEMPVELSLTAVRIRGQWHAVGILRDMTGRKKEEDELRRSEERYRTIFENTGTATIIIAQDMTILLANSNFEKISGCSRQEIEGRMKWPVFIDQADRERMKQLHELRRTSPGDAPGSYECLFRSRTGEKRDIFITVALIPGTEESVASLMDITERKKAEEDLQRSEQNYRNIMDSIQEAYYEVDLQGNFTFFNTMAWMGLGYSEEELRHMNFHTYVDEETAKKVFSAYNRVFTTGEPIQAFEFEAITAGGQKLPIEASVSLRRDGTGEVLGFKGVVRDVSLRKDAEKALRESEERYRLLAENVDDVIWTMNREGRFTYVSPSVERKRGFTPQEIMGTPLEDMMTPASFALFSEKREHLISEFEKGEPLERFTLEMEVLKKDGSTLWVDVNCSGIYDSRGNLMGILGVSRDITERRKAEESLRQSEQRKRLHVEQTPLAVIEWDKSFHVTQWNRAAELIFGYTAEEAVGQHASFILPDRSKDRAGTVLEDLLSRKKGEKVTYENLTRDGRTIYCEWYNTTLTTADGEIIGIASLAQDITERKLSEQKLRELSLIDELTGLNNRRGFVMLAAQQLKIADRFKQKAVLIYGDLDRMKWINDTHGHKEGDRALIDTAAILTSSFRASDIIARLGGDEFVGLAVESGESTSEVIISRLQEHLNAHNIQESRPYKLSISFGIAQYDPADPCSLDELLEKGDKLMYEQKQARKQAGGV